MSQTRVEHDSMGEVRVPRLALWGAQTQRAIEHFPVSGERFPRAFLGALAQVKLACARANHEARPDRLPGEFLGPIEEACREVARGDHDREFPLDIFQTGSGTSTNMNANEVIANLANLKSGGERGVYRPIHPNDHVNMGQSSNDIIPTALHLAALRELDDHLRPALGTLARTLDRKAAEFDGVVKLGRTHLMDAVPVRLGQEFGGYSVQIGKSLAHLEREAAALEEVPLGGTAVGTALNALPGAAARACQLLAQEARRPVREARNHFEAQASVDDVLRLSGALASLATALMKIAGDIRLMGSGPAGGLGELRIPDLQPGSSIMPGKVNPVMCEMLLQVAARVLGNDQAVRVAGQGGQFELNTMLPLLTQALLQSISILASGTRLFNDRLLHGLEANPERCRAMLEASPIVGTVLAPRLGYERTADLMGRARRDARSVRDLAVEEGLLSPAEAARLFDFRRLTMPPGSEPRG
jgi:fumarate hydratase class II